MKKPGRIPLQQNTMRLATAANKLAARSRCRNNNFKDIQKLQATVNHPNHTTTTELPFIQTWISLERACPPRRGDGFQRNDLKVLRLMEKDSTWLEGVCHELVQILPIGNISTEICTLAQALIRALTQHNNHGCHSRTLVDDIFQRLLREEDCADKSIVTAVLYGIVTRYYQDPHRAANLLELMRDRHMAFPSKCARPRKSNLTSVLYCWAKSSLPQSPYKARQLLETMSKPNLAMYNTVLHAFYKHKMPEDAEDLLRQLETNEHGILPDVNSFRFCIMAWEQNASRAVDVMERLCLILRPTTPCFVGVLHAIEKTTADQGAHDVSLWIKRLQEYNRQLPQELKSHTDYAIGPSVYYVAMKACAKSPQLEEMEELMADMRSRGMIPNATCWTILIQAWCKRDMDRAEKILQELDQEEDLVPPTATMCHFILHGWNEKGLPDRGHAFFNWMCRNNVHTDTTSVKLVLLGWNQCKSQKKAGSHVLYLLQRLEKIATIQADPSVYELALATLACTHKREVLKFLKKLERLHYEGIHVLSPRCYNLALASSSGVKEVEDVFSRMKLIQFRATTKSFNFMLHEWAKGARPEAVPTVHLILKRMETESVTPDADTYNYILATCMFARNVEAVELAQIVMVHLDREHRSGKNTMVPCSDVLLRISGNGNSRRERTCAKMVEQMVDGLPDFSDKLFESSYFLYSLTVCSMSDDEDAPTMAQNLWERANGRNLRCFNLVLKTYARHAMPDKAEQLYNTPGDGLVSDEESFEYVLEAWARSKELNAAQRAFSLLNQRKEKTSPAGFANVLLACSMAPAEDSDTKLHRYNLAIQTFQLLRDGGHMPTSLHYYRLLVCAIQLAPDSTSRVGMITFIFRQCCNEGKVDQWILRRFWSLAPKLIRQKLLSRDDDDMSLSDLPGEWTCHRLMSC